MLEVTDFLNRSMQFLVRLVFWLFAAVAAVCLLAVALVLVLLGLFRALLTGRRPAPGLVFGQFRSFNAASGMWPRREAADTSADARGSGATNSDTRTDSFLKKPLRRIRPAEPVVDVEVREVRDSSSSS
jgi:hypothetical protein